MNADSQSVDKVIMSADIVGSTALYEAVGDERAQAMVSDCLAMLSKYSEEHGGQTLADVGDQVIAMFDDPSEATGAASEIHVHLHEQYGQEKGARIRMRVGLHYGPVPVDDDILVSQTAKIAIWAASNAKPEQTLATRSLIDKLPRIFRSVSRYVDEETWNFVSLEHVEIYEVIWDVESITAYNGEQPTRDENAYENVIFDYEGEEVVVNNARPVISIGRHKECDIVINKDLISRQHLSAQYSRGRCTVTDNSTNGSIVRVDGGSEYEIKRESFRLQGSGVIVVGMPGANDDGYRITFRCE